MEEKKEDIKKETSVSEIEIEKRKKDLINFFKQKGNWIVYGILAIILSISVFIRTRNIPKLKDITTGTWTLGPDLDPFLFLRWAKYIAEHGKLFLIDTMRYVPLADVCSGAACNPVNTAGEMKLLSYMIAGLSNILSAFNKEVTVTYAAIIFPVIMAVLTGIAFFLFARKVFYKEDKNIANLIALVSTAFFVLVPSLLPRTIAGIPEKESAAFFFIFIGFYFFLEAFTSEKRNRGIIFGILAGISTGLLGLTWGGVTFMFLVIPGAVLLSFLLGKVDNNRFFYYASWLFSTMIMIPFSTRYTIVNLTTSVSTGLAFAIFFIILVDFLIFKKKIFGIDEKIEKIKLPKKVISIILAGVILIVLASIFLGISFIPNMINSIISDTIQPLNQNRFSITVAENKQPYFTSDWAGEFGPIVFNIPLYFWLFFIGSVFLFGYLIKNLEKKEKRILILSYVVFLFCLIFSKYSSSSILNGKSGLSIFVYLGGFLFFVGSLIYFYFKRNKEGTLSALGELNFTYILYLFALTMAIVAARGAIRLIMVLGAISPIAVGFLIVFSIKKYFEQKEDTKRLFIGIFILIVLISSIFTLWTYYRDDNSIAQVYAPSSYTQQWQKAMAWVRENTSIDSVFAHWWDYGYWLQSIGERATILDGGNAVGYWNHFMGRNVLTGTNEQEALDFLYAHNGTHLLIDSSDIGKYTAFSSIGSNGEYDRFSWIPTIFMDNAQTQETNNKTLYVYPVGTVLDEDLVLQEGDKEVFLPRRGAYVAAITVEQNKNGEIGQPKVYFVYNNQQYSQPIRYLYAKGKLYDFKSGLEMGIFIFPKMDVGANNQISVLENGAALYLSERTVNSQFAKLYLFNQNSNYFKLAHSEDSLIVEEIKMQGIDLGSFVYYQGLQGPIKIWEIKYPSNMEINEEYLSTDYPKEFSVVDSSEYG